MGRDDLKVMALKNRINQLRLYIDKAEADLKHYKAELEKAESELKKKTARKKKSKKGGEKA